jgi:hypothetical protein
MSGLLRLGAAALVVLLLAGVGDAAAPAGLGKAPDAATQAKIKALRVERRDALRNVLKAHWDAYSTGVSGAAPTLERIGKTARLLLGAELDVASSRAERIAAHEAHVKVMKKIEGFILSRARAGRGTMADTELARAARLEAEIALLRAGGKLPKAGRDPKKKVE